MSDTNVLQVPQDILDSARLTISELKVEIATYLYAQGRLSIGKARELANMSLWEFRQLLASRRISPHYDEGDLDEDVETLSTYTGIGRRNDSVTCRERRPRGPVGPQAQGAGGSRVPLPRAVAPGHARAAVDAGRCAGLGTGAKPPV